MLGDGHAVGKAAREGLGYMRATSSADLVEQAQRPHRHAEIEHRPIDEDRWHTGIEEGDRLEQVGHEDAVDEEPGLS